MANDIYLKKEALEKMLSGLDKVANAVGSTLGPKGLNVFIGDPYTPVISNDGVRIAVKVELKDKLEDAGAYVIKNVSSQQNDDVGDGTTSVVVLTQALIHEALKRPENAMEIKDSLKSAGDKVLKILSQKAVKIDKKDVEKVAFISAENKELAHLITEIIGKLGDKAVISVEDSKTFGTDYEIVDGFEIPFGYMAPYASFGKLTYTNVPVLVAEEKIGSPYAINGIFTKLAEQGIRNCVIACNEIEDATLGVLGINKVKGIFDSVVIRMSAEELQNIAGATGAKMISPTTGVNFQNLTIEDLGKARKIVCDANKTIVMGDKEAAENYASTLELTLENEPNMYLQKKLKDRIAKLKGGVAIMRIGASTDLEREYLKLKAEDAIKATQAALEEGVVEGGGMVLWRIAQELKPKTIGEEIIKKALVSPFKRIVENSGKDYAEVVRNLPLDKGYNAREDEYVDMIGTGILDPAKVERCAVENSISAASIFITTNAAIIQIDETDERK